MKSKLNQFQKAALKVASHDTNFRRDLIRELYLDRMQKKAMEFPTKKALEKYLKEHPDADPKNHSVVKSK